MENFQPTMGLQTLIRSIALLALEPLHSWPLGFARHNKSLYTVATYSDMVTSLASAKAWRHAFYIHFIFNCWYTYCQLSLIITYLASTAISSASYSWVALHVSLPETLQLRCEPWCCLTCRWHQQTAITGPWQLGAFQHIQAWGPTKSHASSRNCQSAAFSGLHACSLPMMVGPRSAQQSKEVKGNMLSRWEKQWHFRTCSDWQASSTGQTVLVKLSKFLKISLASTSN